MLAIGASGGADGCPRIARLTTFIADGVPTALDKIPREVGLLTDVGEASTDTWRGSKRDINRKLFTLTLSPLAHLSSALRSISGCCLLTLISAFPRLGSQPQLVAPEFPLEREAWRTR